jgi:hypothetical protein
MKPANPFPRLLLAFFYERLAEQRNASMHSSGSLLNAGAGRSLKSHWRI